MTATFDLNTRLGGEQWGGGGGGGWVSCPTGESHFKKKKCTPENSIEMSQFNLYRVSFHVF